MKILKVIQSLSKTKTINFRATYMDIDERKIIEISDDDSVYPSDPTTQYIRNEIRKNMYGYAGIINHTVDNMSNQEFTRDLHINNFQKLKQNSFRGALGYTNDIFFNFLENSGIKTVIDLAGIRKVENECKKRNINYLILDTAKNFWTNPIFKTDEEIYGITSADNKDINLLKKQVKEQRDDFLKRFISAANTMNKGNFYIGCEFGEIRTGNILTLFSYFNPRWEGDIVEPREEYMYNFMRNLYRNLTFDAKQKLGFTKTFEEKLVKILKI